MPAILQIGLTGKYASKTNGHSMAVVNKIENTCFKANGDVIGVVIPQTGKLKA